jgi:hypothetical protein
MDNPPIQPPDNHDISIADLVLDTLPSVYKQSAKQPRKLSTIIEMIRTSENLQQISSFGLAYLSVIVLEPLVDLAVLALAKVLHNLKGNAALEKRLYIA